MSLLASEAAKMVWGPQRSLAMNTIRTLGLAAVAALSLGVGAAMAQEGANDTISGSTYFGNQAPVVQGQVPTQTRPGMVQSGSSDVQTPPANNNFWRPGVAY
jgi:hypothetical protein